MLSMSDPRVTVSAYTEDADAFTAKGELDAAGIDSAVDAAEERRARVKVRNEDALRAGDVLTARFEPHTEIQDADEEIAALACPACGSIEVESSKRALKFILVILIIGAAGAAARMADAAFLVMAVAAIVFLIAGRWRCGECGETWD